MAPPRRDLPVLDEPAELAAAYATAGSLSALADSLGASAATVRRAMIRHGIQRNPRNTNRRAPTALLDDAAWLRERYANNTGVELAAQLGVSPTTIYRALRLHGVERRHNHGKQLRREPRLNDIEWLAAALPQGSSTEIAKELHVSPGTVTNAYRRANLDPGTTRSLHERGRHRPRPSSDILRSAWEADRSIREVARRLGTSHTTARVWLAEIGIFASSVAALSERDLFQAISSRQSIQEIAHLHGVSSSTVKVELHRHGLFHAHRLRHLAELPEPR